MKRQVKRKVKTGQVGNKIFCDIIRRQILRQRDYITSHGQHIITCKQGTWRGKPRSRGGWMLGQCRRNWACIQPMLWERSTCCLSDMTAPGCANIWWMASHRVRLCQQEVSHCESGMPRSWSNVGLVLVHRLPHWPSINPFSVGTDFRRRQILTSKVDDPRTERVKYL